MEDINQNKNLEVNTSNGIGSKELTNHEKKQLRKEQREKEEIGKNEIKSKKELNKKIVKYSIITLILLVIVFGGYYFVIKPIKDFEPYYKGAYHWHANFEVSICGQLAQIKCGAGMCGMMNFHHHNDNIIHIEGSSIAKKEDLYLGNFFRGLGLDFSNQSLFDKKNGDLCPNGNAGIVKMYVDGQPNYELDKYILKKCDSSNIKEDCEEIDLKFE